MTEGEYMKMQSIRKDLESNVMDEKDFLWDEKCIEHLFGGEKKCLHEREKNRRTQEMRHHAG